ncbi:MAG: hypothetical protein HY300_08335 [Verrucomicrobia bacterium]|nr:hypothetical protein [Verrucomicrobiota bacterium]
MSLLRRGISESAPVSGLPVSRFGRRILVEFILARDMDNVGPTFEPVAFLELKLLLELVAQFAQLANKVLSFDHAEPPSNRTACQNGRSCVVALAGQLTNLGHEGISPSRRMKGVI